MSAIVPVRYALKRAAPVIIKSRPYKRAKTVLKYATMARRIYNTPAGRYAARRIGRAARKYVRAKRLARSQVGHKVGGATAKKSDQGSSAVTGYAERTMHYHTITYPSEGQNIDQRERKALNLRGFKFCLEWKADTTGVLTSTDVLYVNVCLVTSKRDPTAGTVDTNQWFRAFGDNRSMDFDAVARSIDFHCRSINTDEWNVFFHKRFKLHAPLSAFNLPVHKTLMKYVPINRQIRFDSTSQPDTRFHLVWWCAVADRHTITPITGNVVDWNYHITTYFRELKT